MEKAVTVGSGDAIILSGGMAVRGRWSKPSATAFTTHTDASGAPIRLPPGRTWVELAGNGAAAATREARLLAGVGRATSVESAP